MRADAALVAERDRARTSTHAPFGAVDTGFLDRRACLRFAYRARADVRPVAVVRLADVRVEADRVPVGRSNMFATSASATRYADSVLVGTIGASIVPSSSSCVAPISLPCPLPNASAAGSVVRSSTNASGTIAVTPLRIAPLLMVGCQAQTQTLATSVIALPVPRCSPSMVMPRSPVRMRKR